MATQFPEGEQPDAKDPTRDPYSPSTETANVPLLPPGEVHPLPGQLETAPDGSIRPATPPHAESAPLEPPRLDDAAPGPPTGPQLAPPAPGLMGDVDPGPVGVSTDSAAGAPAWALAVNPEDTAEAPDDTPGTDSSDSATRAERAAWPTVEPGDPLPSPPRAPVVRPEEASEPDAPPVIADADVPTPSEPVPAPESSSPVRVPEHASGGEEMYDVPLGTLVYRSGLLTADQIESALAESERIGKRLGEVLLDNEMLDERDLGRLLAGQKGLPFLDLEQMDIDQQAAELLPAASATIYCALPIALADGVPLVAVSDPTNGLVVEGVRRAIGGELSFAVATRSDLQRAIADSYDDETADDTGAAASGEPEPPADIPLVDPASAPAEAPAPPVEPVAPPVEPVAPPVEPVAPPVEPAVSEPTAAEVTPGDDATRAAMTVRVMVSLSDGEKVDAGSFDDEGAAIERARALISSIDAHGGSEWPFLNGRFLRPETIVSIDLLHERPRF